MAPHARVAVYSVTGSGDEVGQKVREGMVQILRDQDGFISYDVVLAEDSLISVSRWETEARAEREFGRS
jgi:hypothetical protein